MKKPLQNELPSHLLRAPGSGAVSKRSTLTDLASALSPELRSFLDNAVIPVLVREYIAAQKGEKAACAETGAVADCSAKNAATPRVAK